jgi:hypothetical protein
LAVVGSLAAAAAAVAVELRRVPGRAAAVDAPSPTARSCSQV